MQDRLKGKKLLMLGISMATMDIIKYAQSMGVHVIFTDNIDPKQSPGKKYANEYWNISTDDIDKLENLAIENKIDGVLAYASDPAAPTAAYVAEKLSLPGNNYETIRILSEKDLFRSVLLQNGFNTPSFNHYDNVNGLLNDLATHNLPLIIKPVDSSGSKGVAIINNLDTVPELFHTAMAFSRCKRVIIEDYIDGPQLHGDGFVLNSNLIFSYLGDHLVKGKMNSSTTYPSILPEEIIFSVEDDVKRLLKIVGFGEGGLTLRRASPKKTVSHI